MISRVTKFGISIALLTLLVSCANTPFYHKNFMRGQVVSVSGANAVVCIGSYNDELIGSSLNVFAIELDVGVEEGREGFRREHMGVLKIDSIINEHFARATISSGRVTKNNMVELSR